MDSSSDWNTALADIERGLRSAKPGDQAEAVAKVPLLFQKHHFPIFVNATFLKLAETFRNGTNFLRQCIVGVCQNCPQEIITNKILSKDEVLRRIFTVSFSNDPIARSLTLTLLAYLSPAFSHKQNVHDFVRRSLDSNHIGELKGAVLAANRYAAVSSEFFCSIFGKVCQLLNSPAYPPSLKTDLLLALRNAQPFHLEELRSGNLLSAEQHNMLKVTTDLSVKSVAFIPSQVDYLLSILKGDTSRGQKSIMAALKGLRSIARRSPHFFPVEKLPLIIGMLRVSNNGYSKRQKVINDWILSTLSYIVPVFAKNCAEITAQDIDKIEHLALVELSPKALEILIQLILSSKDCSGEVRKSVLFKIALFFSTVSDVRGCETLFAVVKKFAREDEEFSMNLAFVILETFVAFEESGGEIESTQTNSQKLLVQALDALGDSWPRVGSTISQRLYERLKRGDDQNKRSLTDNWESLAVLLLRGTDLDEQFFVELVLSSDLDFWQLYRIARSAMRFAKFFTAKALLGVLVKETYADDHVSWLTGLQKFCEAAIQLQQSKPESVLDAGLHLPSFGKIASDFRLTAQHFQDVCAKSGGGVGDANYYFPLQFCLFRATFLEALEQLRLCSMFSKVHSAPRHKRLLRDCAESLGGVSESLQVLIKRSFDADHKSIVTLHLYLANTQLIADAIQSLVDGEPLQRSKIFLAVSPNSNPVSLLEGQGLALKVEGVVEYEKGKRRIRNIESVNVEIFSVSSSDESRYTKEMFSSFVPVNNDYFSVETILHVKKNATLEIKLELIDKELGQLWYSPVFEQVKVHVRRGNGTPVAKSKRLME